MKIFLNNQISEAIKSLSLKLEKLNIATLDISDYNREYLRKYLDEYPFYMFLYAQLLSKAIKKLKKPIFESTFVDYGGGCGMLSYLAKEIGFKTVIYNDIYEKSTDDAQTISKSMLIPIDHFICGDVEEFIEKINENDIKPDLICSFDVLEHIYNLKSWFTSLVKIRNNFSLLFMTSANSKNPFIVNRLMKLHKQVEFKGIDKNKGWKEIDSNISFLQERKKIIKEYSNNLRILEINDLAFATRGLRKDDILKIVDDYNDSKTIDYHIKHPTNTCDPYTGNWAEHLINLNQLKAVLKKLDFKVTITNSYYSYSKNKVLNIPKYVLNLFIKMFGEKNLLFSPTYTLEIQKT